MAYYDFPFKELEAYCSDVQEPSDFAEFWNSTLKETRRYPLEAVFSPMKTGFALMDVYDVTFSGFAGQRIKAWYLRPRGGENLAVVVQYVGYGGGRGLPVDHLRFPAAGYGILVLDTRGQGSVWSPGDTPDLDGGHGSPQIPGFMTRGILAPEDYYYRRLFTDAVRALETAAGAPGADPRRTVIAGVSQGGGLTLAVSGLSALCGWPEGVFPPAAALPEVPFLCDFERAAGLVDTDPYGEIRRFCVTHRGRVDQVFHTLSYFDGVNFARHAAMPALFSVGLMDTICPPSTVYGAYNAWEGLKEMKDYRYNNHEGGGSFHFDVQLDFLRRLGGF